MARGAPGGTAEGLDFRSLQPACHPPVTWPASSLLSSLLVRQELCLPFWSESGGLALKCKVEGNWESSDTRLAEEGFKGSTVTYDPGVL